MVGLDPAANPDVIILGCVKTKGSVPAKAKDLGTVVEAAALRGSLGTTLYIYSAEPGIAKESLPPRQRRPRTWRCDELEHYSPG